MQKSLEMSMVLFLALALCAGIAAADLVDGLVGYWPLDGNADNAVGNNAGEPVGDPAWVAGHLGQAVGLDGSQHINVPDFELTTNTITFAAWINGWKAADWAGIVGSRNPTACEMIFGDNDTVHYVWNDNAQATWGWADGAVIPQNEWALVALTVDPDKAVGYTYTDANGLQKGSNDIPHIEQTVGVLNIGWVDCCGGGRYFMGIIDEVMVYDRALSEDEILQLAIGGLDTAAVKPTSRLTTTWGSIK